MKRKAILKRIRINHFGMGKEKKGRTNKKTKEKGSKDNAEKRIFFFEKKWRKKKKKQRKKGGKTVQKK